MGTSIADILIHLVLMLLAPPLMIGIIARVKARFAGRTGPPLLQPYRDIARLMKKEMVFSATCGWMFRAAPLVTLAAVTAAALLVPLGNHAAPVSFPGDMILFAYFLALSRFFTIAAALDTGSSFEGMGGAREATYSALAEPTLFFILVVLATESGSLSLTEMLAAPMSGVFSRSGASLVLLVGSLFIILLAENSRIPFDDPSTHLELTMIHEVMVLDHSGPLLGLILYGSALKLFVFGAFFTRIALPFATGNTWIDWGTFAISMAAVAVAVGVAESAMARFRLVKVPHVLLGACVLAAFSTLVILR